MTEAQRSPSPIRVRDIPRSLLRTRINSPPSLGLSSIPETSHPDLAPSLEPTTDERTRSIFDICLRKVKRSIPTRRNPTRRVSWPEGETESEGMVLTNPLDT